MDDKVADLLRRCLNVHGGQFDPSRVNSKAVRHEPGEDRVYFQLNRLLLTGGLRPFVERRPEFSWTPKFERKGMLITWAPPVEHARALCRPEARSFYQAARMEQPD